MKIIDREIESLADFIKLLGEDREKCEGPIWFRGQSNKEWALVPSINRIDNEISETNLMKKFKQNATLIINKNPQPEEIEWLFLMRHYGIHTRLLDWSESPLVAAYFAVETMSDTDGAIWALSPIELNKMANIAPDFTWEIPSFDTDNVLKSYLPCAFASEKTSKLLPVAFIAPRNSPRMQSQLSVFTISHRDLTPIEKLGSKEHVWRYIIPKDKKEKIKKELRLFGISKFQIFPELQSIGECIKDEQY